MPKFSREGVQRFLKEETLFRTASQAAIERLGDLALQKTVPRDGTLFTMGQTSDALHFVVEGCALLVKLAPDGRQRILHRALPGEMVGAVPFFDGQEYPASFVAETECVVLSFPRSSLLALLAGDPTLSLAIIGGVVERLRMMTNIVEQMSFEDAEHRLWDYLMKGSSDSVAQTRP
jgi:CRP-like cAMP-binding protein